jgi:putative hydrolase of the HAD superfamily
MNKKAIFFDLDNTLYPVSSIGDQLFAPLLNLISQSEEFKGEKTALEEMLQRKPFHYVAAYYGLSDILTKKCVKLLQEITCDVAIKTFDGYQEIKKLPQKKFLITAGFTKLQLSKLYHLGIENDFDGIYIIDQSVSNDTKKSKFADIMADHGYTPADVLVVGDDPASEIQAAKELDIDAVLYDSLHLHQDVKGIPKIDGLEDLVSFV